ncbi:MAG: glycosyltransferase [Saprospiraceae bacterium]|nr:glycosyltransferase [Saprospiraceae bacterium]
MGYYRKYVPKYLKRANHIVTVSEFVKKDIITHLNIPTEKISVAYNAVSPPINVDDIKLPATFIKAIDNKLFPLCRRNTT